jgi:hypothetical protein
MIRNPWGKSEWQGPWSDGSEQWTPEWMVLLNHKFGDDGVSLPFGQSLDGVLTTLDVLDVLQGPLASISSL